MALGIREDSEEHNQALALLKENSLPLNTLVISPYNPEYLRLPLHAKSDIEGLTLTTSNGIVIPLSSAQQRAIESIFYLYFHDADSEEQNKKKFMDTWDSFSNLKTLREWWDNIEPSFSITSVGSTLAYVNAHQYCPEPPQVN